MRLFVDPNARGYGLGQQLGETALHWCRCQGMKKAVIWLHEASKHAHEVAKGMGCEAKYNRVHTDINKSPQIGFEISF